jgi:hypothetical protein
MLFICQTFNCIFSYYTCIPLQYFAMKKYVLLSLVVMLTIHFQVMGQTDQSLLYQKKIQSYTKTKNAGLALLITGIGVTVAGSALLVSELSNLSGDGSSDIYTTRYYVGLYGASFGLDMIIGGIILNTIGSRKVKQYQTKLNNLSAGVTYTPGLKGVTLIYRF